MTRNVVTTKKHIQEQANIQKQQATRQREQHQQLQPLRFKFGDRVLFDISMHQCPEAFVIKVWARDDNSKLVPYYCKLLNGVVY